MNSNPPASSKEHKLPRGPALAFLGSLFLIGIFDTLIGKWADRIMTDHTLLYAIQRQRVEETKPEILFLGDSSLGFAIDADQITRETGRSAINLGLVGYFGAYGNYQMLRACLDRGQAPQACVLMHVYDAWHREIHPVIYTRCPPRWKEVVVDFLVLRRRPVQALDITLAKIFSTYRYKGLLQNALCQNLLLLGPIDRQEKKLHTGPLQEFYRKHGWSSMDRLEQENARIRKEVQAQGYYPVERSWPGAIQEDVEYHQNFVRSERFNISSDNRYWLDRTTELAASAGVSVYFVYGPLLREFKESSVFQSYRGDLRSFFQEYSRSHPGFHLLTDDFFDIERGDAINAIDHLSPAAKARFSSHLVSVAKSSLLADKKIKD